MLVSVIPSRSLLFTVTHHVITTMHHLAGMPCVQKLQAVWLLVVKPQVSTRPHMPTLPRLDHRIRADPKFFRGRGRWRTDSAINLRRKAYDSCKLSVGLYIWLLGALPSDPTAAPPLDLAGVFHFRPPNPLCPLWFQSLAMPLVTMLNEWAHNSC